MLCKCIIRLANKQEKTIFMKSKKPCQTIKKYAKSPNVLSKQKKTCMKTNSLQEKQQQKSSHEKTHTKTITGMSNIH